MTADERYVDLNHCFDKTVIVTLCNFQLEAFIVQKTVVYTALVGALLIYRNTGQLFL